MIIEVQKPDRSEAALQTGSGGSDAQALTAVDLLPALTLPLTFNETSFDRKRGNTVNQPFSSTPRTATAQALITNFNARGLHIVWDITAASGTGGLTLFVEGVDNLSGKFYTILSSAAAIIVTGTIILKIYPGLVAAANLVANDIVPRTFRIRVAVGDASSYTYTIAALLVL